MQENSKNGFRFLVVGLLMQFSVGLQIVAHPSSLLLPVNEIGVFTCTARCNSCSRYWIINDSFTEPDRDQFIQKGFAFLSDQWNGNELTMTLTVNASEAVNNTEISCEFDPNGGEGTSVQSTPARLLVIANSPLSHNPVLEKNTTHVTVTWSPPFLWPGHVIDYYMVSFVNQSDGRIYSQRVDSSFSDHVVSYTKQMPGESLSCTAFSFCISASGTSRSLQTFNISSSLPKIDFPLSAINTSILYKSDGMPALVEVNVQLPESICSLNYTLLVEDEQGNIVRSVGPYLHTGSDRVKQAIAISDLRGNQMYTLKARVGLYSQVATSDRHYFNTSLKTWDTNARYIVNEINSADGDAGAYKAATGVSLTIAIVMFSALILVIISVYFWHKQRGIEKRCKESKSRVCHAMVPNPIYDGDGDGPVYDSVRPQYETLVAVAPSVTAARAQQQASTVTGTSHNNDPDVVRYVDPPIQLPQFRSQSFTHTLTDIDRGSASRSYSVSLPPPSVMALKKNGQERNKLHLTLSLGGSEAGHNGAISEAPPVPSMYNRAAAPVVTEAMDESYMVMNSASVLSNLQGVGRTT